MSRSRAVKYVSRPGPAPFNRGLRRIHTMAVAGRVSTSSRGLDALLGGGARAGEIVFLYGETGAGKTAVAMSLAASLLKRDAGAKVSWVDSDGKFSPPRMEQVLGPGEDMRRLLYARPSSMEGQAEAIDVMERQLQRGDMGVLDSATGVYRVDAGDAKATFSENKELNRQMGQLKEIAVGKGATMVVTGRVRSVLDSPLPTVEPVGQRLLRYWADVVVKLETTPIPGARQATLEKPRRGAVRFRIGEAGVTD